MRKTVLKIIIKQYRRINNTKGEDIVIFPTWGYYNIQYNTHDTIHDNRQGVAIFPTWGSLTARSICSGSMDTWLMLTITSLW